MVLQNTENVELGQVLVSNNKTTVYTVEHVGTSVVVAAYDPQTHVGGIAHVVLPASSLAPDVIEEGDGRYADLAVPLLINKFEEAGGQIKQATFRIAGGAQLFNFGGGGGNILNIGARNATAIRAALAAHSVVVSKADNGGSKARNIRFVLATGQLYIEQIGGKEFML